MAKIKVVHVPVGEEPKVIEVENTLESLQALVGGYIEHRSMGRGLALICNEEGVPLKLPQNGCGMLGPYFFTKVNQEGDEVSLTEEECDMIRAHVAMYRHVRHSGRSDFKLTTFATDQDLINFMDERRREVSGELN
jgi:hypothetical protein